MRRILIALLSCITLATLTLSGYALTTPAERHATAPTAITPSATPTLPACTVEDGSGQALCMWSAGTQGNGLGDDAIGGDCAYEDTSTRAMCITLYARDSYEVMNEDGSSNTIPNGTDLVRECQDELQNGSEWNTEELYECFKAWM